MKGEAELAKYADLDQVPDRFGGTGGAWPYGSGGDIPEGAGPGGQANQAEAGGS